MRKVFKSLLLVFKITSGKLFLTFQKSFPRSDFLWLKDDQPIPVSSDVSEEESENEDDETGGDNFEAEISKFRVRTGK